MQQCLLALRNNNRSGGLFSTIMYRNMLTNEKMWEMQRVELVFHHSIKLEFINCAVLAINLSVKVMEWHLAQFQLVDIVNCSCDKVRRWICSLLQIIGYILSLPRPNRRCTCGYYNRYNLWGPEIHEDSIDDCLLWNLVLSMHESSFDWVLQMGLRVCWGYREFSHL